MQLDRKEIEALLDAGDNDAAIEHLCADGPPAQAWQLALLARAYFQRGDSRGDLYAGRFFLDRARQAGFSEAWLPALAAETGGGTQPTGTRGDRSYALGGMTDRRRPGPAPYRFNALSVRAGEGKSPKDLDWSARNVPCQAACPAGTDIPGYLTAIFDGDHERAYRINLESNVFPGVLGRVCARPCEEACRHGWEGLGASVAICHSKRAADQLRGCRPVVVNTWFPPSGKRVAVIGAGVAGLTAARELARFGHAITVYEQHTTPGGMLNQGIPEFRLPRDVIDREIDQIRALGVTIECRQRIGQDLTLSALRNEHDAVVMAAGTLRPNLLKIPGNRLAGVRHGLDFLLEANTTGTADVGRHVVVIGGGFTAMDCARTAKRLGAATCDFGAVTPGGVRPGTVRHAPPDHVKVWYRRTEEEMLITPGELEALKEEAIDMEFLVTPVAFLGEAGRVQAARFIRTRLGAPGSDGRRRPVAIEGSEFEVPADTVLLATGQFPDTAWIDAPLRDRLVDDEGWLRSGEGHASAVEGVFVAGDFAQGASSLIRAIGHARATAVEVDTFLMGTRRLVDRVLVTDDDATGRIREMDAVPVQPMPMLPAGERNLGAEVETGYDTGLAVDETQRCYRCHYKYEIDSDKCIYCDWCIKAKPRPECILRVRALHYDAEGRITGWDEAAGSDDTYLVWINQEDCIRCGACVDACPVDAISLQKVRLESVPVADAATGIQGSVKSFMKSNENGM